MDKKIFKGALYGLAIGDALGVPAEFKYRDDVRNMNITEMINRGGIPKGTWSDDTCMALATLDAYTKKGDVYKNIMENYIDWLANGKYSPLGYAYGTGSCCYKAITNYMRNNDVKTCGCTGVRENGNGSLMRILPSCFYVNRLDVDLDEKIKTLETFTSLTHAHPISLMADVIYYLFLNKLIETKDKEAAFDYIINFNYNKYFDSETINTYSNILTHDLLKLDDIESKKNGYVVYTIEGVLFSIMKNDNFKDSVLCAINLGFDSDTLGAITGSLAGALYGYNDIPKSWIKDLRWKELLDDLINKFYKC